MCGLLRFYKHQLAMRPFLTNMTVSSGLFMVGDAVAQHAVEKVHAHDWSRTGRMGFFGGFIAAPIFVSWYAVLDRVVTTKNKYLNTICRVGLDQTIFAPFAIGNFFVSQSLLEGRSFPEIKEKLEASYYTALQNNWKVWPMVQVVNFSIVPTQHRLLVVNTVSVAWNSYLSYMNTQGDEAVEETMGYC
ncbi:hypothetical protein SAICODRAFT_60399 [Saitoella complicata NRRL Y-17804]|uniref:uncharacterized protein n=1 Tax=Saitoella complicata (strain BCRC 22490 / CBS 7301 / JCM 7358 / NBRC 10748 / NRRL Y-17804) TaxID=698492 RepID=UPI000867E8CB|nr:uncharacterized protein SAICODRAFT_60399 [Saitoella complicata NRRL Y-17804]ODQ51159.1 hypothetical protein SAICODRAFT_60399 [Saitoella complicata NRRL Y-17804]